MKKQSSSLTCMMVGLALFGCGGSDPEGVEPGDIVDLPVSEQLIMTEDGEEIFAMVAEAPPLTYEPTDTDPWVVAEVDVGSTNIKFWQVTIQGDDGSPVKSMLISILGPNDVPSPVDELRNSSEVPLTLAEIYSGLTDHRNVIPDALMDHHFKEVAYFDRSDVMIEAVRVPIELEPAYPTLSESGIVIPDETQKQQDVLSSRDMVVAGDNDFTPSILNHDWVAVHIGNRHFCPNTGVCANTGQIRSYYICTLRTFWDDIKTGIPSASTSCTRNQTGWLRLGVFNLPPSQNSTAAFAAQQFYGPSINGAWASFPPASAGVNQRFTYDWNVPEAKRMALAVSRQQQLVYARLMSGFARRR